MSTPERQLARYLLVPVIVTGATLAAMRSSQKVAAEYDLVGSLIAVAFTVGAVATYVTLAPPAKRRVALAEGLMLSMVFCCGGAIVYPVMQSARSASGQTRCLSNVKQMLSAEGLYSEEFGDRYPSKTVWRDALEIASDREGDVLRCPRYSGVWGYAFNEPLSSRQIATIEEPAKTVNIFEADGKSKNTYGRRPSYRLRHGTGVVGLCDLHAGYITDVDTLRWNP